MYIIWQDDDTVTTAAKFIFHSYSQFAKAYILLSIQIENQLQTFFPTQHMHKKHLVNDCTSLHHEVQM